MSGNTPINRLMTPDEAAGLIREGRFLMLAGDEAALRQLPAGNWMGGTMPYFMEDTGGVSSRERLFVTELPVTAGAPQLRFYDVAGLDQVCVDGPDNGYSLIIIPAFSAVHSLYARRAQAFEDMFIKPVAGWVAGCHLDDLGRATPQVVLGSGPHFDAERAVVMHVPLSDEAYARIDILNAMAQGGGDSLRFAETGFSASACTVNGEPRNLAEYLLARGADRRLPLVADYGGASVNVSIKAIDGEAGRVDFYAPVFDDVEYRLAAPVDFSVPPLEQGMEPALWSCNCILNYAYWRLEGQRTGTPPGAMSFGEIAYLLLNQTQVCLRIGQG